MKCLALGPGAMGVFVYLGTLYKLKETGRLEDLEEISGASAGSLVGFSFLIGNQDIPKILDHALEINTKSLMKPNIKTLLKDYGLVPVGKVRKVLEEFCFKFTNKIDITFRELYEISPIKFHVAAFCVDLMRTEYFSIDTAPAMSVLDAVCMSISVPFLFSATKLNGWHYVDGATAEVIPGGPFIGRQRKDVFAVKLAWSRSNEIKDLKTYGLSIMYSALRMRASYDFPILDIDLEGSDVFDFGAGNEGKLRMFMLGQSQQIS